MYKNRKRALESLRETFSNYFFAQVNIKVTTGHHSQTFPKFPNYMIWLHIIRIILVSIRAAYKFIFKKRQKALETLFRQYVLIFHLRSTV